MSGPVIAVIAAAGLGDPELAAEAQLLITMGGGDECPYGPAVRCDDWPLDDPEGRPVERARAIRDGLRARVEGLADQEGAGWKDPPGNIAGRVSSRRLEIDSRQLIVPQRSVQIANTAPAL